jgi:autophagy-related protein 27
MLPPAISSYFAVLLALPAATLAATLDCEKIRIDKQDFNLGGIGGPKTVHFQEYVPPSIYNTTFTIDICSKLDHDDAIDKLKQCPMGTRVCGIQEAYHPTDGTHFTTKVQPIAGEFTLSHGRSRALDPRWTRLKGSASNEDTEREGLRLELNGGKYPDTKEGMSHKAIVEFLCDPELTGNEGFEEPKEKRLVRRAEEGEGEGDNEDDEPKLPNLDEGKSIQFVSFKNEGEDQTKVLRLSWKTKYACEGAKAAPPPPKKSSSWGFFTWFLIM